MTNKIMRFRTSSNNAIFDKKCPILSAQCPVESFCVRNEIPFEITKIDLSDNMIIYDHSFAKLSQNQFVKIASMCNNCPFYKNISLRSKSR